MRIIPLAQDRGHVRLQFCIERGEQKAWQERRVLEILAVRQEFTVYGDMMMME